ncbi:MAG: hypothetical protein K8J09_19700 [Planctomycetes bacterium]|jgi:hypothetical protein|nr:hypothetical protein [Planctomycetota bacterium]
MNAMEDRVVSLQTICVVVFGLAGVTAQSTSHLVVPTPYSSQDAVSFEWVAGASRDVRQQTLVGAAHLAPVLGQEITAIELRRTAADETYLGGTANLTVTISTAPHTPLECSQQFAANSGAAAVLVFSGLVTLPTSPPELGPSVAWDVDNTIRIPLQTPFLYLGGTLCVDIVGQPVPGQNANWWMADAEFENISGSVVDLGGGCGIYGGATKAWSHVDERSLLPGAYARFFAYGTPYGFALTAFGLPNPNGIPLSLLGLPAATGCDLHLGSLDMIAVSMFVPDADPLLQYQGGRADVTLKLPGNAAVLGLSLTTQWIDWAQMATSNAIEWTIAGSVPTLDMALVEGHPSEPTGNVSVHLAHVMRFEYQ